MRTTEIARGVLQRLEQAWNAGDGEAYGREFTDAASFVNIHGARMRGAEAIATGHDQILSTIYAGSVNQMRLIDADQLSPDVIVCASEHTLDAPGGPLEGRHRAVFTSVLVRSGDDWRIAAAHNTLMRPQPSLAGAR